MEHLTNNCWYMPQRSRNIGGLTMFPSKNNNGAKPNWKSLYDEQS